nr:protein trichome birefringence-like [Tanacetum cinerariifolium]
MYGPDGWENVEAPVRAIDLLEMDGKIIKRQNFKSEPSYAFVFKDFKSTLEFFMAPFLVKERETIDQNGTKRRPCRLT